MYCSARSLVIPHSATISANGDEISTTLSWNSGVSKSQLLGFVGTNALVHNKKMHFGRSKTQLAGSILMMRVKVPAAEAAVRLKTTVATQVSHFLGQRAARTQ
jgi:hypothetical protein